MTTTHRRRRFGFATAALVLATYAGQAFAQAEPVKPVEGAAAAQPATLPQQVILRFERAPLASFLVDPKDQSLKNALAMIPARVSELPMDSQGQFEQEAAEWVELALNTIAHGSRLAVTFNPQSNAGGAMGYGLITQSLFTDAQGPSKVKEAIDTAITRSGTDLPKSSKAFKGMRSTMVPGGRLAFGPRTELNSFDVYFGTVPEEPANLFKDMPAPSIKGLSPIVTGTFDFQGLTPLANLAQLGVSQAANGNGVQAPNVVEQLTVSAIIGENAINGQFEFGYTANASCSRITVNNASAALAQAGQANASLSAADLNVIPADALSATIAISAIESLSPMIAAADAQSNGQVRAVLDQIKEVTEVDLEKELLGTLGGTAGYYTAQSTGGGLLGYVAFMGVKDRATFATAHAKLTSFARTQLKAAQPEGARFIRLRSWEESGVTFFSLVAAGLPFPGEITYALTDRFLIIGLTQQAVTVAAMQAVGKGDKGILSRTDLGIEDPTKRNLLSFGFTDTAQRARQGYNALAFAGTLLSNGVRSAGNTNREPGSIVPLLKDLLKDVRPSVSLSYRDGDRFIMESWSDRSILVNAASSMGTIQDFVPLIAAAGAGAAAAAQQNGAFSMLDSSKANIQHAMVELRDRTQIILSNPRTRLMLTVANTLDGPSGWFGPSAWLMQFSQTAK